MASQEYSYLNERNNDISSILRNKLDEKISKTPEQYQIRIEVLNVVQTNNNGQWKERLLQAKNSNIDKHITLIPCVIDEHHWIGVIIKLNYGAQVESAEFFDPVIESTFDPINLQRVFVEIFPNSILRAGNCEKHRDRQQSMQLTIQNLLSAAVYQGNPITFFLSKENLVNLQSDYDIIPMCSEKSLVRLLLLVSVKLLSDVQLSDGIILVPNQIENEIEKEFKNLNEYLNIEEVQLTDIRESVRISLTYVQNADWNRALGELRKIFKKLYPLNIHELLRLVDKVDSASKLVVNNDVILFLGDTGTGKSTTIHFLAGSKMIETEMQGLPHIAPDLSTVTNLQLKKVTSTPFAQSETRYITPVTVSSDTNSVVLCDCPGFEDTNGPEVDIANGIGIIRAIKSCKSVKPVILISYLSAGDRYQGLKELARVLVGLIAGIEDHKKAFSYFFTKYPSDKVRSINAALANVRDTLNDEEKSDTAFVCLLKDMCNKTKKGVIAIDPIHGDRGQILSDLIESASISRPDEAFQFYITEKSKSTVRDQVEKHKYSINSAIKRSDYVLIKYKLDQLKHLHKIFELEYIEQAYKDTIRFVNNYLKKERDDIENSLKRCFTREQLLNDEVIQQVRAYIDHADNAEILRNEHIGREFISSKAVMCFLIEQVKSFVSDLTVKTIDDTSIINDLHVLKLLAQSFPENVSSFYNDVYRVFTEKIENVARNFQDSYNSEKFNECANELDKLKKSQEIFQDHVYLAPIKELYEKLKSDFIKYLEDCTKKLDHLFVQVKLDEDHIRQLNVCVNLLGSVKDTLPLYAHISVATITKIQEDFLLKIISYFDRIIKNIDKQLEKSNPFDQLELPIKQLDYIRTIPSIKIRTSESYFKVLETICGCIRESKRTVEGILNAFERDDKGIKYDQLMIHVFRLKSIEWFREYRSEVYLNTMKNVESQIIQRVEDLKRSLTGASLDLSNYNKLESIAKIVLEINAMKPVESIFNNIGQIIFDINNWFEKAITKVLTHIRETFSFSDGSQQQGEEVDIDIDKLDKAFHYLDICKTFSMTLNSDWESVLNSLQSFTKHYYVGVGREIEKYFGSIQQYPQESKEAIFKYARMLSNRLKEISELKTEHEIIVSYLPNQRLVDEWTRKLKEHSIELSDVMKRLYDTKQTGELVNKLDIAKALSACDMFLTEEKYIDLYRTYQDQFFTQNKDAHRNIIVAIKEYNYAEVSSEIIPLEASNEVGQHFYKDVKRALNFGLENLIIETKNQAITLRSEIELEEIKRLVENLRRIRQAKQFVSNHLHEPSLIDETIKSVEKMIEEKFERFLNGVGALIDTSNFFDADKKIVLITTVRTLLGQHCTARVCQLIDDSIEKQNAAADNLVKLYSELEISDYSFNPPVDIFGKFQLVHATNKVYDQALQNIQKQIRDKFLNEMNEAKTKMLLDSDNPHIRKIECALRYLPDTLKNVLESELNACKEEIRRHIQDHENSLIKAIRAKDLTRIENILRECSQSEDMQSFVDKSQILVFEEMQKLHVEIVHSLEQHRIHHALNTAKKLYESESKLAAFVVDIENLCSDIRSLLDRTFQDAYNSFSSYFFSSTITYIAEEISNKMSKNFSCLIEFIEFRDESESNISIDSNEKINIFVQDFVEYLNKLVKEPASILEQDDITTLKYSLDFMHRWNSLLISMHKYTSGRVFHGSSTKKIIDAIGGLITLDELKKRIVQFLDDQIAGLQRENLINAETKEFSARRDEYYRKLSKKLWIVFRTSAFNEQIPKINELCKKCLDSLKSKVSKICVDLDENLKKLSEKVMLTQQEYADINMYFSNFISFKQQINVTDDQISYDINQIEKKFLKILEEWESSVQQDSSYEKLSKVLIRMKRTANSILPFKKKINEQIDNILSSYKVLKNDAKVFAKLGTLLSQDASGIGQMIIAGHRAFQGFSLSLFNEKTKQHDIDYVLNHIDGDTIDKAKLRKRFDEYHEINKKLIGTYLHPNMKLDKLISDTILIVGRVNQTIGDIDWDANVRDKVPKLMAHIFALWTLNNSEHFFEAHQLNDRDNYLLRPHAAQVISIFRMLGIGDKTEELKNNLVQIGTGEGKSVTLAVTASVLALLGFDVSCACYSEYLSQRDYKAFSSLFDLLGVTKYIHYGTFKKLCEDMINQNGNVREIVENLISTNTNQPMKISQTEKRAKILLIDEVDVFFSREFYGNVYIPSASLRDPTITALIDLIWRTRESRLNFWRIKNTNEYKDVSQKFSAWSTLIDEAIKDMLSDVKHFESHNYSVVGRKIGYLEQDSIAFEAFYGYKTLFAHYFEFERNGIDRETLEEVQNIEIKCGSFSYAEIPIQFECIMGVTGTLRTLSDPEKKVIETDYKIKKSTFSPSVYGKNNLKFTEKDDIMIENSDDYLNVIRKEIDKRLCGNSNIRDKRAVLVFFESEKKLEAFYNSPAMTSIKDSVCRLTEEATLDEKESLIKRATGSGQVTLFTKVFGRGTDFICYDEAVNKNNGVHVIQTFLSDEPSEEVQIKGRTARQGEEGSYSMVLSYSDLEKFQITEEDVENVKRGSHILVRIASKVGLKKVYRGVYELLNEYRTGLFKMQYEGNRKYVEEAKEKHKASCTFLSNLSSGNIDSVRTFLINENKGAQDHYESRTICLLDATGSMYHLLQSCKQTISTTFQHVSEILTDHKIDPNSFEIQFAVYRNYNSREDKILQSSTWERKPDNLRTFLNNVESEGGWHNEAIEIGLWHANTEHKREPISQVILIGDAPPNTIQEVASKRSQFGESYWKKTKFARPTYYNDELNQLRTEFKKIPVHAFYVDQRAKTYFENIASATGGRSAMLDIVSSSGAQMLTDLMTEEVLKNVGGATRGNDLVQAYRSKFKNSRNNPNTFA